MFTQDHLQAAALPRGEEEDVTQALPILPPILSKKSPKTPKTPLKQRIPKWSESEDQLLLSIVPHSRVNWKVISRHFPGKHKSAIRRRWENKFDPNMKKSKWTEEEDAAVVALVAEKGMIWKEIAKSLPGRPPDMVKNRYYGHIKRMQDLKEEKEREAAGRKLPSWEEVCRKVPKMQFE